MSFKCYIWDTPARELGSDGRAVAVDSPRAGGHYRITGTAVAVLKSDTKTRKLLTTWLCDQRSFGIAEPEITSYVLDGLAQRNPLRPSAKKTRALRFLDSHLSKIGEAVRILWGAPDDKTQLLMAATECEDIDELQALLRSLEMDGVLIDGEKAIGVSGYTPSGAGWAVIEQMAEAPFASSQAFVAMWFDPSTDEAYTNGFVPAIQDAGYSPLRIDKKEHSNKIDDEIIAEIRRSRFVVADFTCPPKAVRGGVYYEAGFAKALGKEVIWTCRDTSMNDLHFDTRQYPHIVWKDPPDLKSQLTARIGALLGQGPLSKS